MNDEQPTAQAVAVKQGRIIAVGDYIEMVPHTRAKTTLVDLKSNTLLPGFIDAHGHVSTVGFQSIAAGLLSAPDGDVNSITAVKAKLNT